MRPRLTGGVARGRALAVEVPASARPTSARVREALFSLVGQDLRGLRVLDAFGGSGLMALEAWSRGAEVTVIERDRKAARTIRANAAAVGASVTVRTGDLFAVLPTLSVYDGVLVDPPYQMDPAPALASLAPRVGRWLVLEGAARDEAPAVSGLVLDRRRVYGGTALCIYRPAQALGGQDG